MSPGGFQVIRAEIGTTKMGLRDIVCGGAREGLKRHGRGILLLPPLEQVTNTKDSLVDMMAAFEKVEPERGLLLVLDELLDYLRSRRDAELIVDLAFLREIGRDPIGRRGSGSSQAHPRGAVRQPAFRFRVGRHPTRAGPLRAGAYLARGRRVRSPGAAPPQERRPRRPRSGSTSRFTPAFDGMAERLEEFVALFPVHPSYLRTFERVTLVEKRRVLTTLSAVPWPSSSTRTCRPKPRGSSATTATGPSSTTDPSNRSIPDVALVLDRTQVLRSKLESALPQKEDVPVALRIVDALAVHRLTTEDIDVPIGLTVESCATTSASSPKECRNSTRGS